MAIQTLNHFKGHSGKVTCIKVQGDFLYSSSEDATVRQWNIKTAKTTVRLLLTYM